MRLLGLMINLEKFALSKDLVINKPQSGQYKQSPNPINFRHYLKYLGKMLDDLFSKFEDVKSMFELITFTEDLVIKIIMMSIIN